MPKAPFNDLTYDPVLHVMRDGSGEVLGSYRSDGYHKFWYRGQKLYTHRVIWMVLNGPIPEGHYIDHKDGNCSNNDPTNLRLCTPSQNLYNSKTRKDSVSGIKGLRFVGFRKRDGKEKWQAYHRINTEKVRWKTFYSEQEAILWLKKVREQFCGEFTRH